VVLTCTVRYCRIDDIGLRDVHNAHDVRAYARHGGVVSYERAHCVVWTPSSFATEPSVVWAPSGFCDVLSTHNTSTWYRMDAIAFRDVHNTHDAKALCSMDAVELRDVHTTHDV